MAKNSGKEEGSDKKAGKLLLKGAVGTGRPVVDDSQVIKAGLSLASDVSFSAQGTLS